jgi:hypothetical protein
MTRDALQDDAPAAILVDPDDLESIAAGLLAANPSINASVPEIARILGQIIDNSRRATDLRRAAHRRPARAASRGRRFAFRESRVANYEPRFLCREPVNDCQTDSDASRSKQSNHVPRSRQ